MSDETIDSRPEARGDVQLVPLSSRSQTLRHLCAIAFCGAGLRLLYHIAFKPCWSRDSHFYSDMFYFWTRNTYSTSARPPAYAIFLGLAQRLAGEVPVEMGMAVASQHLAVYLQSLLGLMAALGVYAALRAIELRPRIALAGALVFSLLGAVCLFELLILTELLSLFFIVFGSCFFLSAMRCLRAKAGFRWPALFSGFCFSLAILTRPENLVFFVILIALVMVLCVRSRFRVSLRWAAWPLARLAFVLCASAAPLVVLWMSWNLLSIGEFRLNTITGVTRTESVYNIFDRVEPADKVAGELLQKSYLLRNRNGVVYRSHVWDAMPELVQALAVGKLPVGLEERGPSNRQIMDFRHWLDYRFGLHGHMVIRGVVTEIDPVNLYDYLGDLSGRLARRNPSVYLHNIVDNFLSDTFTYSYAPPGPMETEDPRAPEGGSAVRQLRLYEVAVWINRIEAPLLSAAYVVLIGYVLFSPLLVLGGSDEFLLRDGAVVALALAAFSVVAASCVVAAYYPQHGIPFLGILVICVCFALDNRQRISGALHG